MNYKSLEHFIDVQETLLKLEHDREVSERQTVYENQSLVSLERRGVCVRNLSVDHQKTGLYGRFLITFSSTKKKHGSENEISMHSHRISSGDIVGLYSNKSNNTTEDIPSGIVTFSKADTITVAFNEDLNMNSTGLYRLLIFTNDVTYRRLKRALDGLKHNTMTSICSNIIAVSFPCMHAQTRLLNQPSKNIKFFNERLDASQKEAVNFALHTSHPISVIHGPPGTGKSTTVVEVVTQAVKTYSMKVLVCAPSNIAVDNLVERLHKAELKVIRIGHPARTMKEVQQLTLDAVLTNRDSSQIIQCVRDDITSTVSKFKKCKNKSEIFALRKEVKELRKELATRESKAIKEVLSNADVVLATTTSSSNEGPLRYLDKEHFDLLIIDEAAQAMEISCWIPMKKVPRCILAGDHQQLPPTIISDVAAKKGLAVTLLERVVKGIGENVVCMLTTQYRMHEKIMQWSSEKLYNNKLEASPSVKDHLLCHMENVKGIDETEQPLIFVDTAGCEMYESNEPDEQSKGNVWEVEVMQKHVDILISAGVKAKDIGIITPYNLQVEMLRNMIHTSQPNIEINSVDGFQGREKEAILISMVRSNDEGEVGFLAEDRRINVAITRARRHLFIVADSSTLSNHPFLESLCCYLHDNSFLRSAKTQIDAAFLSSSVRTEQFELPSEPFLKVDGKHIAAKHIRTDGKQTKQLATDHKDNEVTGKSVLSASSGLTADVRANIQNRNKSRSDIEKDLDLFISSSKFEVVFSSSLSSRERAIIHEIAEKKHLNHISQGEGMNRKIIVTKGDKNELIDRVKHENNSSKELVSSDILDDGNKIKQDERKHLTQVHSTEKQSVSTEFGHVQCPNCTVLVPAKNLELHSLRCEKMRVIKKQNTDTIPKVAAQQPKKKKKKKKDHKIQSKEEEDVDMLLDSFAKLNSKCTFEKCKTSIKTFGQKCEFCSQMFCLTHHMAEIHGCGKQVKIKARQDIAKYHGLKPTQMNGIKKCQVQKILNNKINNLEDERRKKNKEK